MDVPADVLQILKCSRCEAYLSRGPVYLQHDGAAVCGRCYAPERPAIRNHLYEAMAELVRFPCRNHRACENQAEGCTHTDINEKCEKHEWYFCQQGTWCWICCRAVSRGSLSAHYDSAHKDETYRAGSTWQAIWPAQQCCLVSSVAGVAVCWYLLNDSRFTLQLHIPVSSERLSEFRCTVRLTHRDTGLTHTYSPDVCYTMDYDWRIDVESEEFPSWRTEIDVCVDIARAGTD